VKLEVGKGEIDNGEIAFTYSYKVINNSRYYVLMFIHFRLPIMFDRM